MEKRLYVGNLPYSVTKEQLETLFSQVGSVVDVNVIEDRDTGRSKGFAFVEMETEEQAAAAVEQLNGQEMDGRQLNVSEARPRPPREERGGGGGRGGRGGGRSRSNRW